MNTNAFFHTKLRQQKRSSPHSHHYTTKLSLWSSLVLSLFSAAARCCLSLLIAIHSLSTSQKISAHFLFHASPNREKFYTVLNREQQSWKKLKIFFFFMFQTILEMVNSQGVSRFCGVAFFCWAFFIFFWCNRNCLQVKDCQPAMKDGVLWKETKNIGSTQFLPYAW